MVAEKPSVASAIATALGSNVGSHPESNSTFSQQAIVDTKSRNPPVLEFQTDFLDKSENTASLYTPQTPKSGLHLRTGTFSQWILRAPIIIGS